MARAVRSPLIGVDRRSGIRRLDLWLALAAVLLLALGLVALASVGVRLHEGFVRKQMVMAGLGLVPFAIFFAVDPQWWRRAANLLYALNVCMLAAVLFVGNSANGSQRWIDLKFMQFQPSEMAKLLTILTLAAFFVARREAIARFSTFALSLLHVAVPAALIAKQPHYGGATVLLVIWLSTCIAANVPWKYILATLIIGPMLFLVASPLVLHGYHLKRIESMRVEDRNGASYQQDRAEVAMGAGGVTGVGWRKGAQTLPEQENDFIFTVLAEDFGLVGGVGVLSAFSFFFYRIWLVMVGASDPYLRMIVAGVLGMLGFHTLVNLGMVVHLLPVVGLWLPFVSAGGTALWLCLAAVGLVLKVRTKEKPILF